MKSVKTPTPPESKLLELLRKKEPVTGSDSSAKSVRFKVDFQEFIKYFFREPLLALKQLFMILALATIVVVVWSVIRFRPYVVFPGAVKAQTLLDKDATATIEKSLESYLSALSRRRLFRTIKEEVPIVTKDMVMPVVTPPPIHVTTLSELVADWVLVGIIDGDPQQSVFLNKKTQKTNYVSEGQRLGEIKLIKINDNSVILEYNLETMTLTM